MCFPCQSDEVLLVWKVLLARIGLSNSHIKRIYDSYKDICNKSETDKVVETIGISSILKYIGIESNLFIIKLFRMLMKSKFINFESFLDFCYAVWNLGTLAESALGTVTNNCN